MQAGARRGASRYGDELQQYRLKPRCTGALRTEAEPLLRKGPEIRKQALGEAHPDTAMSYNNVAANLTRRGRYDEAEPFVQQGA